MSGIKDRVAIIGMGCSKFGERWDSSSSDLLIEASYEAFEDAGIESKDVQAAWLGTVGSFRTGQPLAAARAPPPSAPSKMRFSHGRGSCGSAPDGIDPSVIGRVTEM